jgi:hypothetical protein
MVKIPHHLIKGCFMLGFLAENKPANYYAKNYQKGKSCKRGFCWKFWQIIDLREL